MRMRPVADIPVPANGSVTLQPGGLHLMLIGLTQPLAVGQSVPVTLRFERAGEVTIQLAVQAAGARQPGHGHRH
jgi:copper(I)-binding protein